MTSIDAFIETIDTDLAWRKKETSNLLLLGSDQNQLLIVKASLLLLYSHWEGYIKNASKAYLEYISTKRINLEQLTDNFKAIKLKGLIKQAHLSSNTLTLENELNLIKQIGTNENKVFSVSREFSTSERDKSIINTKDNLSLNVFKSILRVVGIDYSDCIDTKSVFIDEKLLGGRNKVAHGNRIEDINENFDLTLNELKKIKEVIFYLMDTYAEDLKYFAENELYFNDKSDIVSEYLMEKTTEIRNNLP